MTASANGWRLLQRSECLTINVPGGTLPVHPKLAVIFTDLAERYHATVEPLVWPGCWGYAGPDRYIGKTKVPSNHWSGTAVDLCASAHPQGVPAHITMTQRELDAVHDLEVRYGGVLVWGGRWTGASVDAMHWEVGEGVSVEAVDRLTAQLTRNPAPPAPAPAPAPPAPAPAPAEFTGPDLRGRGIDLRGEVGANGERVRALQAWLLRTYPAYARAGLGADGADGWWGAKTSAVLAEFATRSGIRGADGANIGPQIARKLYLAGARV